MINANTDFPFLWKYQHHTDGSISQIYNSNSAVSQIIYDILATRMTTKKRYFGITRNVRRPW